MGPTLWWTQSGFPRKATWNLRIQEQLRDVRSVAATSHAFAAIRDDGTVVSWGHPENGGHSQSVQDGATP